MRPAKHVEQGRIAHGERVDIVVDGERMTASRGQTVAAVLLSRGIPFRATRFAGRPRALYCGMGMCYDCTVYVDGVSERACMVKVSPGMQIALPRRFQRA